MWGYFAIIVVCFVLSFFSYKTHYIRTSPWCTLFCCFQDANPGEGVEDLYRKKHWGRCFLYALLGYFVNTAPRPEGLVPCTQLHSSWLGSLVHTGTALLAPQFSPENCCCYQTAMDRDGSKESSCPTEKESSGFGSTSDQENEMMWLYCGSWSTVTNANFFPQHSLGKTKERKEALDGKSAFDDPEL